MSTPKPDPMDGWPIKKIAHSRQFADWLYARTGVLATTEAGEKLRSEFLSGHAVMIRLNPGGSTFHARVLPLPQPPPKP